MLVLGLLLAVSAEDGGQVAKSIYVESSGLVHATPGDSYATSCPPYTATFGEGPGKEEAQCGVVRRICVPGSADSEMHWEETECKSVPGSDHDECCKPVRWQEDWSPYSNWYCRAGTETRCRTRGCPCGDKEACYNYFKDAQNRRRNTPSKPDFTSARCDPQNVQSGAVCHAFDEHDGALIKTDQKQCETREFVCHCPAEKNTICPHCSTWDRTPAGATATAKCGCGYKGQMQRQCTMSPDQCSCRWEAPSESCEKVEWNGWGPWDRECPVQCKPTDGREPEKIYRTQRQTCKQDESECEAAATLGCIEPRGVKSVLCQNYKVCECTEPTKLFKDPIQVGGRPGAGSYSAGSGSQAQEPAKLPESSSASQPKSKPPKKKSKQKAREERKTGSIFDNLLQGVQNIFTGEGKRKRRARRKRKSQ